MKQAGWQQRVGTAVLLAWMGSACGQSVDTSMAQAKLDQPLSMAVQVRGFDWPASRLTPECLQVQIQQGESGETMAPVRVRTFPSGEDGRVVVQISSPQTVTDTVLTGRLSLLCGADYTREFTVLVDPPAAQTSASTPASKAPTKVVTRPTAAMPSATPAPHVRNTTRPDDEAPLAPPASRPLEDAEMQRLVSAVVAALALTAPNPAASPVARMDEDPVPSLPWQDLREEQRQTRARLTALSAQFERSERDLWRGAALVMGTLVGLSVCLLVLRLVRESLMPRIGASASATARRLHRQRARRRDADPFTPAAAPEPSPPPEDVEPDHGLVEWSSPAAPATPESDRNATPVTRWPDADFGHPSLDMSNASAELLNELEPHAEDFPIGVAVVLERRLQELPGKCPWILLRLLDLYRQMAQPWNHERVAAQLEALYNVRIPEMASPTATVGDPLEAYPNTLDKIEQAWALDEPAAPLSSLLLRPTRIEVLDQPAFEDVLLLHGIVQQRQSAWLTAVNGGSGTRPSAKILPEPSTSGNRLLDLLLAA